ncbi:tetratricopeptide repeat-containing protein [Toxoplasma gondii GT1]|uniref:Tetratricopeptide repeat-containing protein n=3 Tax=Toxoplasma gondii TaxID=5811 RepID=S7WE11_TOXGG|nr:tetratricopeptide repeat-containing protein [Toxoplasma gondii GT1]KAF4641023.1 tetratricopeptide repeat-containing protein [Toxoplasma gondii]RQX71478.1 tetratricopeptide repeat-containing protein [Toxoplasma gondii CAST]
MPGELKHRRAEAPKNQASSETRASSCDYLIPTSLSSPSANACKSSASSGPAPSFADLSSSSASSPVPSASASFPSCSSSSFSSPSLFSFLSPPFRSFETSHPAASASRRVDSSVQVSNRAARTAELLRRMFPSSPRTRSCPFIPFRSASSPYASSPLALAASTSCGCAASAAPSSADPETGDLPGGVPQSQGEASACASGPRPPGTEERADDALRALQLHLLQQVTMEMEDDVEDRKRSLYASFASSKNLGDATQQSGPPHLPSNDAKAVHTSDEPSSLLFPCSSPSSYSSSSSSAASASTSSSSASSSSSSFSASSSSSFSASSSSSSPCLVSPSSSSSVSFSGDSASVEVVRPFRDGSEDSRASNEAPSSGVARRGARSLSPLIASLKAKMQKMSGGQKAVQPPTRGLSLPLPALPASAAASLVTVRTRGASLPPNPTLSPLSPSRPREEASPSVCDDGSDGDTEFPACTPQALLAVIQEWPLIRTGVSESAQTGAEGRSVGDTEAPSGEKKAVETVEEKEESASLFQAFVARRSRLSRELEARLGIHEEAAETGDTQRMAGETDGDGVTDAEGRIREEAESERESVMSGGDERDTGEEESGNKEAVDGDRRKPGEQEGCDTEEDDLRAFDAAIDGLLTSERPVTEALRRSFFAAYRPLPPAAAEENINRQSSSSSASLSSSPSSSPSVSSSVFSSTPPYAASWCEDRSTDTTEAASLFSFISRVQTLALRVDRKFNRDPALPSCPSSPSPSSSPFPSSSLAAPSSSATSSQSVVSRAVSPSAPLREDVTLSVRHISEGFGDFSLWLLGSAHTGAWREGLVSELAAEARREAAQKGREAIPAQAALLREVSQTSAKETEEHTGATESEQKGAEEREVQEAQLRRRKDFYVKVVRKLQRLEPDELVEGCFIIDRVLGPQQIRRTIACGRQGRREFLQALDRPDVVVRGWVVRCDSERALLLVRLVAVELYPSSLPPSAASSSQPCPPHGFYEGKVAPDRGTQATSVASVPAVSSAASVSQPPTSPTRRRLLRTECDVGSSGIYGALPLAAVGRYECKGGQASGCVSRFLPVGTAVRACVKEFLRTRLRPSRWDEKEKEAKDETRLDESTLNAAHAHLLLTLSPPACLTAADAEVPLQKPLGFVASTLQDALCLRCQDEDFLPILPLQPPTVETLQSASSASSLSWWDGGASLLRARLPFVLFSDPRLKNRGGLAGKLHALDLLRRHFFSFSLGAGACSPARAWRRVEAEAETELAERREAAKKRERERQALWRERTGMKAERREAGRENAEEERREAAFRGLGAFLTEEQSSQWAQQRLQQGVAAARKGDLTMAMECYEAALVLKPKYPDALVARGAAHANRLAYDKALDDLDAALAQEPQHPNAIKYRRIVLQRMENQRQEGNLRPGLRHPGSRTPSPTVTRASRTPPPKGASSVGLQPRRWGLPTALGSSAGGSQLTAAAATAVANAAAAANAIAAVGGEKDITRLVAKHRENRLTFLRQQQMQKDAIWKQQLAHAIELEQRTREKRMRSEEADKDRKDEDAEKTKSLKLSSK